MRVLVCVRRLDKGGAEMLECRLAQHLNRIGVHADLAGQYDKSQFDGTLCAEKWLALGVPEVVWLKANGALGILTAIIRLIKTIHRNKYDVVISHHSGLDIIASIACFMTGKKHVAAFHDYFYKDKIGKIRLMIWRGVLSQVAAAYSISDYVTQNIYEVLKVSREKNSTIYNSITVPVEDATPIGNIRRELNLPEDAKLIVSSGRINYNKGFDLSIHFLKDTLLHNNVFFLIMGGTTGDAEEHHLEDLIALVKKEKLESKVLFIGYRKDAFAIMKQCDLYIHMARHEGFGLVLTEAIAAGLPILASDAGGIPEVLRNTSYPTFPLTDKEAIVKQASLLLALSPERKMELTGHARKVLPFFTDERRAAEVKKVLEETLS
jgi:glycosyltransferase involved in cell wall biosynthesis